MRILHINCNYIGTKLHQSMIAKLSELGVENSIYVPTYLKDATVADVDAEVCISKCFRKWDRVAFDYKQHKIISDIEKKFDISKFDCIHAYTLFTDGNTARYLAKKYGKPYVVAVRGTTDINTFFRIAFYLRHRGVDIMLNAKKVFFMSKISLDNVLDKYVQKQYHDQIRAKSVIIPNGIDDFWHNNRYFRHSNISMDTRKLSLIYAGRIDKNKNIPAIQKAMDILRAKHFDTDLTVIGKIDDKAEAALVKKHPHTHCFNAVEKERLLNYYRKTDLFVMPSHSETFGVVYAEAMSQGLPVIYTKNQGFDGQFDDGLVGYAVDDYDPTDIADKIMTICSNYDKISENCTKHCEKFNWNDIVREYYSIYEQIIRSKNK